MAASASGMMTEIGFSENDAMFGQGTPVGVLTLGEAVLRFEFPPSE